MPVGAPPKPPRRRTAIERLYLAYLLCAPVGATVMAAATYRGPKEAAIAALWLGGAIAVAIYAGFVGTYLVAPTVWWRVMLAIVDGPIWLVIAAVSLHGWEVLDFTTWYFVSESLGIFLAIAIVAGWKLGPDASLPIAIMLGCMIVVCLAAGWALFPKLAHDVPATILFVASIVGATASSVAIADRDRSVRDADASAKVILVTLGLFHAAIGLGILVRFTK